MSEWQAVIGLEIHAQLKTKSKLFSGAATQFGAIANSQACAVDVALPGTLPVVNKRAIELAIRLGIALDAEITQQTIFVRKNYFYPDLPKNYQISQLEKPIVANGTLSFKLPDGTIKTVRVNRAHLEEDAGKSIHTRFPSHSGIDLNRAGIPLLEIVSEPDLRSAEEAGAYMREIHSIVRYLDICDGNMQEGSLRCDANVSVRRADETTLGTRTEIKNLNSFRFIEKAIAYEIERHIEVLEAGATVTQETRLYDSEQNCTRTMRSKEESHDYQYFPDPDLLPVMIDAAQIEMVRQTMPELPSAKAKRYCQTLDLSDADVSRLVSDYATAMYFEQCLEASKEATPQAIANWVNSHLAKALKQDTLSIEQAQVSPTTLATLLDLVAKKIISNSAARNVFQQLWTGQGDLDTLVQQHIAAQEESTENLADIVQRVIQSAPQQVEQYRAGKTKVLGFFVGRVIKEAYGADPAQVSELVKQYLEE